MRLYQIITLIIILAASAFASMASVAPIREAAYANGNALDGVKWLKATDTPASNGELRTVVDIDAAIEKGNPAVIFGWTADRAYFQWQIMTDTPGNLVLRRCVRTFTDNPPYDDVKLPGILTKDAIGKKMNLRIEASGNNVTTYIDGKKVDTYKCSRQVLHGKSGIRLESGDEVAIFNFKHTLCHPNGNSRDIVSENFSGRESLYFLDAEPTNGQWHASSNSGEKKYLTVDESYPAFYRYFEAKKGIAMAHLHASALGIYDVWINGQRVGTPNGDCTYEYDELKPGWTDYSKHVAYNSYDVTALCKSGENSIGAVVTPGWLSGRISRNQYKYPLEMAFAAKLVIQYTDGSKEVIATDNDWSAEKYTHILRSDIYNGEIADGRRPLPWADKNTSMPCKPQIYDYPGNVDPCSGPAVRIIKDLTLQPVKTVVYAGARDTGDFGEINQKYTLSGNSRISLKQGETAVVDFGQNCSGVPRIKVKGNSGARVHMRFGEALNDTGEKSRGNDGPAGSLYTSNLRSAKAELYYVLRGDNNGETYTPTTTYYGYRYCEITATTDIEVESVETCPLSSSHEITGYVDTDNEDINRLFSNILWSQLSNFISVPTDCPQRDERLGWTADAQLFATTAMYNANVGEFYRKWLRDIRDAQRDDGAYADVAPLSLVNYGSAGWSDAGISLPWQVYIMTGDKTVISEHYDSMERYMTWLSTLKADGLTYCGAYNTYGDLFAPHEANKRFVSQAYYYHDAVLMAKMSKLLSTGSNDVYDKKASSYQALADAIKQEIQTKHFDADGLKTSTQGGCVISLWFGLYGDERQQHGIAQALAKLIEDNGYRLDTGFISSAYVLQVLCDNGHTDLAYELLTQHAYPSWMYMIDNGATTMWENWYCYRPESGFCDVQRNSFNHFAIGSFGSWMYSHMAGIKTSEELPGFSRVIFSPCIDMRESCAANRKINRAHALKQTTKGTLSAQWQTDGNALTYDIIVPEGIDAEVRIPVTSEYSEVYEGGAAIVQSGKIQHDGYRDGRKVYTVKPGEYHFSTSINEAGISAPEYNDIEIWPNPACTVLNISSDEEIIGVEIISVSGDVVHSQPDGANIDVSSLPHGLYFAKVSTKGRDCHVKFIKK